MAKRSAAMSGELLPAPEQLGLGHAIHAANLALPLHINPAASDVINL